MKTIKILLILLFVAVDYSFAGKKKESYQIDNGVTRVWSKVGITNFNGSGFMKINANNNVLSYQLEMFTDGKEKQYSIQLILMTLIKRSKAFFFPTNAKLLIKLQDDSIIELSSIYTQNVKDPSQEKACSAHFPITEDQLNKMFNGVKKIRVEIIKLNDEEDDVEKDYRDVDFKKDVLGKRFGEFYKEINETLTTMSIIQEKKVLKSKKNLLDDF